MFIPIEQGSAIILDRRVAVPTLVVQSCTKRIQTAVFIASVVVTNIAIGCWAMIRIGIFDIRVSRFADTLPSVSDTSFNSDTAAETSPDTAESLRLNDMLTQHTPINATIATAHPMTGSHFFAKVLIFSQLQLKVLLLFLSTFPCCLRESRYTI